jgi:hypothetical protein
LFQIGAGAAVIGPTAKAFGGLSKVASGFSGVLGKAGGAGLLARVAGLGVTGPVGLAIAGVAGLGVGIYALNTAFKEHSKVNLEKIENMQTEIEKTDELINRFEELKSKNELSTDEMLRYMDILALLDQTNAPDRIKELKDEQADLLKESTLTNDEMNEFLGLNDKIVEKSPATEKSISNQGEAYVETTDAIRAMNEEKRNALREETRMQLLEAITEHKEEQENLNELIAKAEEIDKKRLENDKRRKINKQEQIDQENVIKGIKQELAELSDAETIEDKLKADRLEKQLGLEKDNLHQLEFQEESIKRQEKGLSTKYIENQNNLDSARKELAELDNVKFKYEEIILSQLDLNFKRGKGLDALDAELKKLESEKKKNRELLEQGDIQIRHYNDRNSKLDDQIDKLQDAKAELEGINERAKEDISKNIYLNEKPNNFWDTLNTNLSKPVSKIVHVKANNLMGNLYSDLPGYAEGTDFHSGGPALVGEEGTELVRQGNKWSLHDFGIIPNLKRGADVFTADQTKKMLANLPAYATGAGAGSAQVSNRINDMSSKLVENINNNNLSVRVESADVNIDGHVAGKVLWRPIKENIDRNQYRSRRSPRGGG